MGIKSKCYMDKHIRVCSVPEKSIHGVRQQKRSFLSGAAPPTLAWITFLLLNTVKHTHTRTG